MILAVMRHRMCMPMPMSEQWRVHRMVGCTFLYRLVRVSIGTNRFPSHFLSGTRHDL